jgi:hypothetical protein
MFSESCVGTLAVQLQIVQPVCMYVYMYVRVFILSHAKTLHQTTPAAQDARFSSRKFCYIYIYIYINIYIHINHTCSAGRKVLILEILLFRLAPPFLAGCATLTASADAEAFVSSAPALALALLLPTAATLPECITPVDCAADVPAFDEMRAVP